MMDDTNVTKVEIIDEPVIAKEPVYVPQVTLESLSEQIKALDDKISILLTPKLVVKPLPEPVKTNNQSAKFSKSKEVFWK